MNHVPRLLALLLVPLALLVWYHQSQSLGAQTWFEEPRILSQAHVRFPQLLAQDKLLWMISQRTSRENADGGQLVLELRSSSDGAEWSEPQAIGPSSPYEGTAIPQMYSLARGDGSTVFLAIATSASTIEIGRLDLGNSTGSYGRIGGLESGDSLVSPQLFRRPDGSFMLFAVRSDPLSLSIVYSRSRDGATWTAFQPLETTLTAGVNINPAFAHFGGRDIVVFQSLDINRSRANPTNQLYVRTSGDAGATWSEPRELTTFADKGSTQIPLRWDNSRPRLGIENNRLYLVWERAFGAGASPQVAMAELDRDGAIKGTAATVTTSPQGAYFPQLFTYRGSEALLWFSSAQRGARVSLSLREGSTWTHSALSQAQGFAAYPSAAVWRDRVHVAYHYRPDSQSTSARLAYVEPDQSARPPRILSTQVDDGGRTRKDILEFSLRGLDDASGTSGYAWAIDRNPDTVPPPKVNSASGSDLPPFAATEDGDYWVHARALDGAGNWSATRHFRFNLDLSPPAAPGLALPDLDARGYFLSNTFQIPWTPPEDPDTLRYQYSFLYLGDRPGVVPQLPDLKRIMASRSPLQDSTFMRRNNVENGVYLLVVWAIDSVGNMSEPVQELLRFNKFIPSTLITSLEQSEDLLGARTINVVGRGYRAEGMVDRIVLDADKIEPWDYEFLLSAGNYTIISDRRIEGLRFNDIDTGTYWLGLHHTKRGMTFARNMLDFPGQGAVKFGDFSLQPPTVGVIKPPSVFRLEMRDLVLLLVVVVCGLVIIVAAFRLRSLGRELHELELFAGALVSGRRHGISTKRQEISSMKRQGLSLRIKFTFFFVSLVIAVVTIIAYPLADFTQRNQRSVLAQGLRDRVEVIMESLVAGATTGLALEDPDQKFLSILNLTSQAKALQEAVYVTITGEEAQGSQSIDVVWGSSDPELLREANDPSLIDPEEALRYPVLQRASDTLPLVEGRTLIKDAISGTIGELAAGIDKEARVQLGDLPAQFDAYNAEVRTLLTDTTEQGQRRLQEINNERLAINRRIGDTLRTLSYPSRSIPEFDSDNYDSSLRHYLFYRPVLFRLDTEAPESARYYRGMVRLGVDTRLINETIDNAQNTMITTILLFAAIAVAGGLIGALILASIIIIPINRLVKAVQTIKNEEDKERLMEYSVGIKSHDELRTLSDVIDQMAHGLAKAAASSKELLVGKDVQKKFIPLEAFGKEKGTTGHKDTPHIEIFGYYEGAKGVSGDYFTYLEYKPGMYAMIKCDVSGKGVPAALIMVQVATLFLNYFDDWEAKSIERIRIQKAMGVKKPSSEPNLGELVLLINDLIASMKYEGRFAAFNMTILNESTGELTFCNAGDTLVQIYRAATKSIEVVNLNKAPASGMFSSKDFPVSFKEDKNRLNPGDILILVTDGVEESKFTHLNDKWEPEPVTQADIDSGICPPDTPLGEEGEEIGPERVVAILDAIARKEMYELSHQKDPLRAEKLSFDFRKLGDSVEETIMGLMAVEKVFRLVRTPKAGPEDIVQVDRKVDAFLARTFVQYRQVFTDEHRLPDNPASLYVLYSHLRENAQYDDLTILGVRKK